mgnify:CR=1 FL=1
MPHLLLWLKEAAGEDTVEDTDIARDISEVAEVINSELNAGEGQSLEAADISKFAGDNVLEREDVVIINAGLLVIANLDISKYHIDVNGILIVNISEE